MSQNGVVASVCVLGRTVDELFDFDFFVPDYTEVGHCHEDCLKLLEYRLGLYRDAKDLPFPVPEDDHDDCRPFVLKGRVIAVKGAWVCEYFKQYAGLGQVGLVSNSTNSSSNQPVPAAEGTPPAKRQRPR